jgi:1,2-dihydroxy-3-keto-5-methylthiopentene dioxygenase
MKAYWLDTREAISPSDLRADGVEHEQLDPADFQDGLERIKAKQGYVTQDIVEISPVMPNLEAILAKFDKEHLHTDDEVRFVLDGEGIFDIRSVQDRWMRVEVFPGDYLAVPANRYHAFYCTEKKSIRCVRLFKDTTGWTPHYRAAPESSSV